MYVVIHRNNTPGKKEITGKNERRRRRKRYGQSCLCLKANIVRVIKSKRLRWAGHLTRIEEGRSAFKIFTGKPKGIFLRI